MFDPVPESPSSDHLQLLCSRLGLGGGRLVLSRVGGGFHHRMWRLQTREGEFAVKQLAADVDLHNAGTARNYNVTEAIAETFARKSVPAVHALARDGEYLQLIEGTGYLVYPWREGRVLEEGAVSESHARLIASLLADMHRADIDVAGAGEHEFDVLPEATLADLTRRAGEHRVRHAHRLQDSLPDFLAIVEGHRKAVPILRRHLVISHGDLDQKNVLWDTNACPQLIDWECAGRLNPTYEVLVAALDWSGILARYSHEACACFVAAYRQAGGVIEAEMLGASYHCMLGEWLVWLMYNVARAVDADPQQRSLGAAQIALVLPAIERLRALQRELLMLCARSS